MSHPDLEPKGSVSVFRSWLPFLDHVVFIKASAGTTDHGPCDIEGPESESSRVRNLKQESRVRQMGTRAQEGLGLRTGLWTG
ncbi:hypothetical protein EVAR_68561_1 [Eumeta japonica]|uniref:Uncharacterized protein n=1 Tax=Eumeta variegata TaxID=151549 RepID=A0A4C2ABU2_EUMVA|nr:hypothetical protein EVAR_68561_1 [Eumeta japonica]